MLDGKKGFGGSVSAPYAIAAARPNCEIRVLPLGGQQKPTLHLAYVLRTQDSPCQFSAKLDSSKYGFIQLQAGRCLDYTHF